MRLIIFKTFCLFLLISKTAFADSCLDQAFRSQKQKNSSTPIAVQAAQAGVVGLQHMTTMFNAVNILLDGDIRPLSRVFPSAKDGRGQRIAKHSGTAQADMNFATVFFAPIMKNEIREVPSGSYVTIVMSPRLLNRHDYFYNNTWAHGDFSMIPIPPESPTSYLREDMISELHSSASEFVFAARSPILLRDYGVEMLVNPEVWDSFMALLEINGLKLDSLPIPVRRAKEISAPPLNPQELGQLPKETTSLSDFGAIYSDLQNQKQLVDEVRSLTWKQVWEELEKPNLPRDKRRLLLSRVSRNRERLVNSVKNYRELSDFFERIRAHLDKDSSEMDQDLIASIDIFAVHHLDLSQNRGEMRETVARGVVRSRIVGIPHRKTVELLRGPLTQQMAQVFAEALTTKDHKWKGQLPSKLNQITDPRNDPELQQALLRIVLGSNSGDIDFGFLQRYGSEFLSEAAQREIEEQQVMWRIREVAAEITQAQNNPNQLNQLLRKISFQQNKEKAVLSPAFEELLTALRQLPNAQGLEAMKGLMATYVRNENTNLRKRYAYLENLIDLTVQNPLLGFDSEIAKSLGPLPARIRLKALTGAVQIAQSPYSFALVRLVIFGGGAKDLPVVDVVKRAIAGNPRLLRTFTYDKEDLFNPQQIREIFGDD